MHGLHGNVVGGFDEVACLHVKRNHVVEPWGAPI